MDHLQLKQFVLHVLRYSVEKRYVAKSPLKIKNGLVVPGSWFPCASLVVLLCAEDKVKALYIKFEK